MQLDDVTISRIIAASFLEEFQRAMDVEVAIGGAGPAGMTAAYYLAKAGVRTVIFERSLRPGGGMPGGGMMFNTIVVQEEAIGIINEFGIRSVEWEKGYYKADSVEASAAICLKAIQAGAKIYNLITIEDVMIREDDRVSGLVLNWSAVELAGLHVDPLSIKAGMVIDATGHASEICHIIVGDKPHSVALFIIHRGHRYPVSDFNRSYFDRFEYVFKCHFPSLLFVCSTPYWDTIL
jgi:thiamine thiazole synthase